MPDEKSSDRTLTVNYLKSNDFREVACDGALGGPTPGGKLWLAFYTERFPLPRIVRHKLRALENPDEFMIDNDTPAEPIEGRQGVIRNVEFGVYMTRETAQQLHEWLGHKLQKLKSQG